MDTTIASSNRSPLASRLFGAALAVGASLLLASFSIGPASAQTPQTDARVTYADLDLSTETGARVLLHRIDIAAKSACGKLTHSPLLPREGAYHRACATDAVGAAVKQIDAPRVAALHDETQTQAGISLAAR